MGKTALSKLFAVILFLSAEVTFGGSCAYMISGYPVVKIGELSLHGVPEDEALWLQDRGYPNDEERKEELGEAVKLQDSAWVEKNRRGEISRLEEDKILAAYLAKKASTDFREQVSAAEESIKQLEKRRGISAKEITKVRAELKFFTIKYVIWPNAKFPEFKKDRAVLNETLRSIQARLESSSKR